MLNTDLHNPTTSVRTDNTLYLDGSPPNERMLKTQQWLNAALGLMFIIQGIIRALGDEDWSIAYIATGFLWLSAAVFLRWIFIGRYLRFSTEGIELRVSLKKSLRLRWEELSSVEVSTFLLTFVTADGRRIPH
jgi:hypothetical protein